MIMPTKKQGLIGATVVAAVLGAGGAAAATAGDDEGGDTAITGPALAKAKAAALAQTHGGKVTGTEVGDEESEYEVEVTLADGSQVDVQLDKNFAVVSAKNEGPEKADCPEADDNDD
jgi:uncharacterized membrane protein YkoI